MLPVKKSKSDSQGERKKQTPTPWPALKYPSSLAPFVWCVYQKVRSGRRLQLSEGEIILGAGPSWVAHLKLLFLNGGTDGQMPQTLTSMRKLSVPMGGSDYIIMVKCPLTGFILAGGSYLFLLWVVSKSDYVCLSSPYTLTI